MKGELFSYSCRAVCFALLAQAAARVDKGNKEVRERADRASAAKAECEGAAAPASLILVHIATYTSVPAMRNTCVEILFICSKQRRGRTKTIRR